MQCPYACCLKSASEVNDRFSSFYTALNRPSTQLNVAMDDNTDKNIGSSDVAREERHHSNGLSKSKTQDSSIAYSSGKKAYSPIDNLNSKIQDTRYARIWPDIHNARHPYGLYPNPQDAIEKPGNIIPFNHLLSTGVIQGKGFWRLKDFWNQR